MCRTLSDITSRKASEWKEIPFAVCWKPNKLHKYFSFYFPNKSSASQRTKQKYRGYFGSSTTFYSDLLSSSCKICECNEVIPLYGNEIPCPLGITCLPAHCHTCVNWSGLTFWKHHVVKMDEKSCKPFNISRIFRFCFMCRRQHSMSLGRQVFVLLRHLVCLFFWLSSGITQNILSAETSTGHFSGMPALDDSAYQ